MKSLQTFFLIFLILAVLIRILFSLIFSPHLKAGQSISFDTTLLTEPTSHGSFDTLLVDYSNGWSSVPLSLAFPSGSGLHYGQSVHISGKVKYKVLKNGQTITTISTLRLKIQKEKQNALLSISYFLRNHIQNLYEKTFSQRYGALLLGILLGYKAHFPKDFLKEMQITGVVHVLAAEGLNVILVSQFLLGLFLMFLKRQWALALTIISLLFYCMLCGLQPSIVRSTIMMGFTLLAQLWGRQYSSLYGLILAASGMLLYNPVWLFEVGFQLSFIATLGILFIKPHLPNWKIISDDVNTTIAAQVATLPILIGTFGSYGLLSVPANAFVLWTIPPLMVLGGIVGLISFIFEPLGKVMLYICFPFLFFFEKVIDFLASFPWQLTLPEVPLAMTVGYYLMLGSIVLFFKKRTSRIKYKTN